MNIPRRECGDDTHLHDELRCYDFPIWHGAMAEWSLLRLWELSSWQ